MEGHLETTKKRLVRIVAVSDTHDKHDTIDPASWPEADIFIHAGDFTKKSKPNEFKRFRQFLRNLPYKHKIVIAGNHEYGLDAPERYERIRRERGVLDNEKVIPVVEIQRLKQVCTYLCHEYVKIEGLRIFGSPYLLAKYDMGFTYKPEEAAKIWTGLPAHLDVLITHCPPYGILDTLIKPGFPKKNVGCKRLLQCVQSIKPKVHIFGHIHESHGRAKAGGIHFYNVAYLDQSYMPKHEPKLLQIEVDVLEND